MCLLFLISFFLSTTIYAGENKKVEAENDSKSKIIAQKSVEIQSQQKGMNNNKSDKFLYQLLGSS